MEEDRPLAAWCQCFLRNTGYVMMDPRRAIDGTKVPELFAPLDLLVKRCALFIEGQRGTPFRFDGTGPELDFQADLEDAMRIAVTLDNCTILPAEEAGVVPGVPGDQGPMVRVANPSHPCSRAPDAPGGSRFRWTPLTQDPSRQVLGCALVAFETAYPGPGRALPLSRLAYDIPRIRRRADLYPESLGSYLRRRPRTPSPPPERRRRSRSPSPQRQRRRRSRSPSPARERRRSRSPSPARERRRSYTPSTPRGRSRSRSPARGPRRDVSPLPPGPHPPLRPVSPVAPAAPLGRLPFSPAGELVGGGSPAQ
eukprot:tig00000492_g1508.t1